MRERIRDARRLVVKLGSNLFFNEAGVIALGRIFSFINENDTVSTSELEISDRSRSFGDNDKLSALVMSKLEATLLVLLSDVDGLFTEDPRENPDAEFIREVRAITADIEALAGRKSGRGRGGMETKLQAARIAINSGGMAVIANGLKPHILTRVLSGEEEGTLFVGKAESLGEKRRWIAFASSVSGRIHINEGALEAITKKNASLLYAGITRIENQFANGDVVAIIGPNGEEVARGIVNYSSDDASKLIGKHSDDIARLATSKNYDAFITRNNLAFLTEYR